MPQVAISYRYSDTPKGIIKHANAKALRRQDRLEIEAAFAPEPEVSEEFWDYDYDYCDCTFGPEVLRTVVFVWDDGLDYDLDGTPHFDDWPEYYPHSYHHTRKEAEQEVAWLIHHGVEANRIFISDDVMVRED